MGTGLQIGLNDIVQIAVLYIAIYALIRFVKGTRSAPVLLGFCLLVAAALGSSTLFRFDVLSRIIFYLLIYLALSLVVVFQQEIHALFSALKIRRFAFDVELIAVARMRGLKVAEVPVHWDYSGHSTVRVFSSGSRMLWDLFVLVLRRWFGGYR